MGFGLHRGTGVEEALLQEPTYWSNLAVVLTPKDFVLKTTRLCP